ncbi:putative cinnamyl alcohol dehydrogenase 9 [Nymphaea thermarum]|nr:putative cinnamyl alcohol dehydrogenase 9 [Nymphaea thermarum]
MVESREEEHPQSQKVFGWAARDSSGVLSPFIFSRRTNLADDVTLKILYCGICHSDLHATRNEWGNTIYPIVPGHEIIGTVTEVGANVTDLKVGDIAGVGCLVGACHTCESCEDDLENYCPRLVFAYNSIDHDGNVTYGGYSDRIVVPSRYAVRVPQGLPLAAAAPLLCAGITVYSPMKFHRMTEPGRHIGVVGLGGLGHVAVKMAKAFGVRVTVVSTSPAKEKEAIQGLGADAFLVSRDAEKMKAAAKTMDYIIDTVSAAHPLEPLMALLKRDGKLIMVGAPDKPLSIHAFPLIFGRKAIAGSMIGGMKETQEMMDFCGKHNITADVEVINMDYVNTAMDRMAKADVKYRFVIDVANSLSKQ